MNLKQSHHIRWKLKCLNAHNKVIWWETTARLRWQPCLSYREENDSISMLPRKQIPCRAFLHHSGNSGWLKSVLEQGVLWQWGTVGDKGHLYIENKEHLITSETVLVLALSQIKCQAWHRADILLDMLFFSEIRLFTQFRVCVQIILEIGPPRQVVAGVLMNISNIFVCPSVAKQVPFFDKQLVLHLR